MYPLWFPKVKVAREHFFFFLLEGIALEKLEFSEIEIGHLLQLEASGNRIFTE